jgi:hypothetical protein
MEMVKIIIRNACLFQPFRTRSDRVDTLTVQNSGHQYETWCLWDEFSKSRSPSWTTKICKRVHTNVLRLCRGRRRLAPLPSPNTGDGALLVTPASAGPVDR